MSLDNPVWSGQWKKLHIAGDEAFNVIVKEEACLTTGRA